MDMDGVCKTPNVGRDIRILSDKLGVDDYSVVHRRTDISIQADERKKIARRARNKNGITQKADGIKQSAFLFQLE